MLVNNHMPRSFSGLFKGIKRLDQNLMLAYIQWSKDWITFMDSMLQLTILGQDTRNLYVPTSISRIVINSVRHMELIEKLDDPTLLLPVYAYHEINYCRYYYLFLYYHIDNM